MIKQERAHLIWKIIETIYYPLAALAVFTFVSMMASDYGYGFANFWRLVPYLLYLILAVYFLFFLHLLMHSHTAVWRRRCFIINGAVIVALSFASIFLFSIYISIGALSGLLTDGITALYPLDAFIADFLFMVAGFGCYLYGMRLKSHPELDFQTYPAHEGGKTSHVFAAIFRPLFCLIALYFFGAFIVGMLTFDTSLTHFWAIFGFDLFLLAPSAYLAIYEWGYIDLSPEKKLLSLPKYALISAVIGVFFTVYYFVANALDPFFLIASGTALFPIDFMTSLIIGPWLLVIVSLVAPSVAFAHYAFRRAGSQGKTSMTAK
jgi:hypothetical protein